MNSYITPEPSTTVDHKQAVICDDTFTSTETVAIEQTGAPHYFSWTDQQTIELQSTAVFTVFCSIAGTPSMYLHGIGDTYVVPVEGLKSCPYALRSNCEMVVIHPKDRCFSETNYSEIVNANGRNWKIVDVIRAAMEVGSEQTFVPLPLVREMSLEVNRTLMFVTRSNNTMLKLLGGFVSAVNFGHQMVSVNGNLKTEAVVELMIAPIGKPILTIIVKTEHLTKKALPAILRQHGLIVYEENMLVRFLNDQLEMLMAQQNRCKLGFIVPERLGWFEYGSGQRAYNMGDKVIVKRGVDLKLRPTTELMQLLYQRGTLEEWQQKLFVHVRDKPLPLAMVCKALMPLLFHFKLGILPITVDTWGRTQFGKSTVAHISASMFSNGSKIIDPTNGAQPFIFDMNASPAGLSAVMQYMDGLPLIADESTALPDDIDMGTFVYMASAGTGKITARQDSELQTRKLRRTMVMFSGEHSVSERILDNDKARQGMLNRLFSIQVKDYMFPEGASAGWSDQLRDDSGKYYGTAALAMIQALLDDDMDSDKINVMFNEAHQRIHSKHPNIKHLKGRENRVLEIIKLTEVAGRLAVRYGVFTTDDDMITRAMDTLVLSLLSLEERAIGKVIRYIDEASPDTGYSGGWRKDSTRVGFLHVTPENGDCRDYIALYAKRFDAHFGTDESARVRRELRLQGRLKNTGSGRADYYFGKGKDRTKCYLIRYDDYMQSIYYNEHIVKYFRDYHVLRDNPIVEKTYKITSLNEEFGNDD